MPIAVGSASPTLALGSAQVLRAYVGSTLAYGTVDLPGEGAFAAPQSVSASTVDGEGATMQVSFSAPASTGGRTISSYTVEASYQAGASWVAAGTNVKSTPSVALFNVIPYPAGTLFRFRVQAVATNGDASFWSSYSTVTLVRDEYIVTPTELAVTSALAPPAGRYTFASNGDTALALVAPSSAPNTRQLWAYDATTGWHQPHIVPLPGGTAAYADPIGVACVGQYLVSYGSEQFLGFGGPGYGAFYYGSARYYRTGTNASTGQPQKQLMHTESTQTTQRIYIPSNRTRQAYNLQFGKDASNSGAMWCYTSGTIDGTPAVSIPYADNVPRNLVACYNGVTSGDANGYVSTDGVGSQAVYRYDLGAMGRSPSRTQVASLSGLGIFPIQMAAVGNGSVVVAGTRTNAVGPIACAISRDGGITWGGTSLTYGIGHTANVEDLEVQKSNILSGSPSILTALEGPFGSAPAQSYNVCWSKSGYAWSRVSVSASSLLSGTSGHAVQVLTDKGQAMLSMAASGQSSVPKFYSIASDPYVGLAQKSSVALGISATESSVGAINGTFYARISAASTSSSAPSYRFRRTQAGTVATVQDGPSKRLQAACTQASTFTAEAYVGADSVTTSFQVVNGSAFSGLPEDRVVSHGDSVTLVAPTFVSKAFGGTPVMGSAVWRWDKLTGPSELYPRGWQSFGTGSTRTFTADCADAYSRYRVTLTVPLAEGGTGVWVFPEFQVRVTPAATVTLQPGDRTNCASCGTVNLGISVPEGGHMIEFRMNYTACPDELAILQWQYNTGAGWTDMPDDYMYLWQKSSGVTSGRTLYMRYLTEYKPYYDTAQFRCKLTFSTGTAQYTSAAQVLYLNAP